MKPEDKELLLKDLCARFPYGVNVLLDFEKQFDGGSICTLTSIEAKTSNAIFHVDVTLMDLQIEEICPYLRTMSSMTDEERKELRKMLCWDYAPKDCPKFEKDFSVQMFYSCNEREENEYYDMKTMLSYFEYLNSHHFDYRGLIEKGLALEAPEGMYNT